MIKRLYGFHERVENVRFILLECDFTGFAVSKGLLSGRVIKHGELWTPDELVPDIYGKCYGVSDPRFLRCYTENTCLRCCIWYRVLKDRVLLSALKPPL